MPSGQSLHPHALSEGPVSGTLEAAWTLDKATCSRREGIGRASFCNSDRISD